AQVWKGEKDKPVLIFVHGLNEHSGRYSNPIGYFSKRGYTIYAFDQRGHGKSDGLRSFIDDISTYLKDLNAFTEDVRKAEKGKRIFMVGHSMGGQVLINFLARYAPPIAGFVTSSANIRMALKIPWFKKLMALKLARFIPRFALPNEIDPKWISRDAEVVRAYKRDPLVSKNITLGLACALMRNQEKIIGLARRIKIPALILHAGDDHICDAKGSEEFFHHLKSDDKDLKIYEGFYHELFNEFGKEEVFSDMQIWIEKHHFS
ncbi:MAG: lysophospholipase, partial [Deltaproteobacteria bacterium]|nr:lysophospholipase [Deltaproteobacteria bacterium]